MTETDLNVKKYNRKLWGMTAEKIKSNSREKIDRKIEHYSYSVSFYTRKHHRQHNSS